MADSYDGPTFEAVDKGAILGSRNFVIQPIFKINQGGDVHESFQVDAAGKILQGHTTFGPEGFKIRHDW